MPLPGTFLESQRVLADAIVLYPVLVSIGNTADAVSRAIDAVAASSSPSSKLSGTSWMLLTGWWKPGRWLLWYLEPRWSNESPVPDRDGSTGLEGMRPG